MGVVLGFLFLAGAGAGVVALVLAGRHRRLVAIGERRLPPPAPGGRADPLATSLAAAAAAAAGTPVEADDARIADGYGVFGRALGWGLGIGAASGGLGASIVFPPISTVVGAVLGFCVAAVPTIPAAAWIAAGARPGTRLADYRARVDRTCTVLAVAVPVAGVAALPLADGEGWFVGIGLLAGIVAELLLWRARLALLRPPPLQRDDQLPAATST